MTPELVVKLRPAAVTAAPMTGGLQVLAVQPAMLGLHDMLVKEGLAMRPVRRRLTKPAALAFAGGEAERPKERLDAYWTVQGDRERLEGLRARMADLPGVEAAFLAPPPEVMNLTVFPDAAAPRWRRGTSAPWYCRFTTRPPRTGCPRPSSRSDSSPSTPSCS